MGRKPTKLKCREPFEAFLAVKRNLPWEHRLRLEAIEDLQDGTETVVADAAESAGISVRQLQRLINLFNKRGLWSLLECQPRTKITLSVVRERIVPARDIFYSREGRIPSPKELFRELWPEGQPDFGYSAFFKFLKRSNLLATANKVDVPDSERRSSAWTPIP